MRVSDELKRPTRKALRKINQGVRDVLRIPRVSVIRGVERAAE